MSNAAYVETTLSKQFTAIRDEVDQADLIELAADIVRQILNSGPKIISVIGGAASGKTTIAKEFAECLRRDGVACDILSTDDYVVGDRKLRQTKLKEVDAQKKYNFELMDEHVRKIRNIQSQREVVAVPAVDSQTGVAADAPEHDFPHKVGKVDVLIIEGDFPRDDYDLRFYVHVPDAQRLQTNIDRETDEREDAEPGTLTDQFNTRQRTLHKPYTLPALQSADYVFAADVSRDDWLFTVYQRTY